MKYQLPLDSARSEIIFAPFHDPEHAPWLTVHVESTTGNKIVRDSLWDSTTFSWSEADRPARFTLKAFGSFAAGQYDELVLCLALPRAASLRIALLGRAGEILPRWSTPILGKGTRQELVLRIADLVPVLHKLKRLWSPAEYAGIALSVSTEATDVPILSLNWFGLRNSALFASIARQQKASRPDWEPWILPDEAWGPVKFTRGLLFDADALAGVRAKLENPKWRTHFSLLEDRARTYLLRDPEADFGEFLPNHDARYIREAQHGRTCYHWEALVLAFVGLVREDRAMIRHAVRYLMCMVHTRHWTESGEHVIPSSTWTHLCFAEEMTTTSVAILLDWLGFALFSRTHLLVRKALFEKGMAPVARVLASRESIHRMNQGAVFNRAMILGGLMLESDWPRFGTGTVDKAHQSMGEVLDHYVKADGGVHEGVGYLCQTMHATLWAMIAYGRARGTNWRDEVRRRFEGVIRYAAVMSRMTPGMTIPAGDCRVDWFGGDALPIMAAICPDSAFADMLGNCLAGGWVHELTGTLARSGGLVGMVYGPDDVGESRRVVPTFDHLPQSGKVTITREDEAHGSVRLWLSGNPAGATHVHRDVGQFTLEVGGSPVFVDRGMVQYWHPEAHFLSRSWLHNVLTPIDDRGGFPSQDPPAVAGPMDVSADRSRVRVPGCDVWARWMTRYERRFTFEHPSLILVTDSLTPTSACKVAFHLQSPYPFRIDGANALGRFGDLDVTVCFPWAETVYCRQVLIDLANRPIYHICAISPELRANCELVTEVAIEKYRP